MMNRVPLQGDLHLTNHTTKYRYEFVDDSKEYVDEHWSKIGDRIYVSIPEYLKFFLTPYKKSNSLVINYLVSALLKHLLSLPSSCLYKTAHSVLNDLKKLFSYQTL